MARIELPPGCRPHPGLKSPEELPKHRLYFDQFCGSLSSMKSTGSHYGSRAVHFLSFVFSTLKAALNKKREAAPVAADPVAPEKREVTTPDRGLKKYSLAKPDQFLKAFERKPERVLDKLLDLLLNKPEKARAILLALARYCRVSPKTFIQYGKLDSNRAAMRAALVDVFKRCILTKEQLQFQARIVAGDFTAAEVQIMSGETVAKMTPELVQFQDDFLALKKPEALGQILWDSVYAFLDGRNEMEDLMFVDGEERSFDRVIEAMLYHRSLASLRSPGIYLKNQKLLLSLLTHLQGGDVLPCYPTVKDLVDKVHAVLSDEAKASQFKSILLEVLAICDPLSKSPPRRA